MLGWEPLPLEINIRSEIDDLTDRPAQHDSDDAPENSHGASLGEEKFFYVSVTGTDRFHNADFTAPFENGHHQGVDDPDRRDNERQATEYSEERVQNLEYLLQ